MPRDMSPEEEQAWDRLAQAAAELREIQAREGESPTAPRPEDSDNA